MQKVRYQSIEIEIPVGTSQMVQKNVDTLDPTFEKITGLAAYEKESGGIGSYNIGFSDDRNTYHDLVDKRDWMPDNAVPLDQRYKSVSIQNNKQRFKILIEPGAETVAPIRFQMIFRLETAQQ